MRLEYDNSLFEVGKEATSRPYYPSFTVQKINYSVAGSPQEAHEPGVAIANGLLPGSCTGGFIQLAGKVWGSDLVAAKGDSTKTYFLPSDKDAVRVEHPEQNIGRVVEEGVAVLSCDELAIAVGAFTTDQSRASLARSRGGRVSELSNGLFIVQQGFPPRGEITDIEYDGTTVVKWK
jgi:hypothetical protein